ncbi:unnamed protein product [Microthlaspi erraticum]|uniref:Uncharacterized protein n=1 Tax=Microthlaspi erraticum TaxID=1685480 RepID=A0A6D2HRQ9_9BRAS|nr:unnamed protein product [Microthlaspi erraticum]
MHVRTLIANSSSSKFGIQLVMNGFKPSPLIVSSPSSSDEFKVLLQVGRRLPLPTSTYMAFKMLDCTMKLPKQLFGKAE